MPTFTVISQVETTDSSSEEKSVDSVTEAASLEILEDIVQEIATASDTVQEPLINSHVPTFTVIAEDETTDSPIDEEILESVTETASFETLEDAFEDSSPISESLATADSSSVAAVESSQQAIINLPEPTFTVIADDDSTDAPVEKILLESVTEPTPFRTLEDVFHDIPVVLDPSSTSDSTPVVAAQAPQQSVFIVIPHSDIDLFDSLSDEEGVQSLEDDDSNELF